MFAQAFSEMNIVVMNVVEATFYFSLLGKLRDCEIFSLIFLRTRRSRNFCVTFIGIRGLENSM